MKHSPLYRCKWCVCPQESQGEGQEWGLSEEEEQGFGNEDEWDEEQEQSEMWDTGTPEPHEGPPMTMQDLTFNLSELLDSDLAEDDTNTPPQCELNPVRYSFRVWC